MTQEVKLADEQKAAVKSISSPTKTVTILTGAAGSGKSTVIQEVAMTAWVTICATTGKAAMNVGGCTVDSLFSLRRDNWSIRNPGYLEYVMGQISDTIIVDEASAVGKRMGDLIYDIAVAYKKRLILVGDWAQSSPVKDDLILDSRIVEDFEFIKLVDNHRQDEGPYLDALNLLRVGTVNDFVKEVFAPCVAASIPDNDEYIRLFATNRVTSAYNLRRFNLRVTENKLRFARVFASFTDVRVAKKSAQYPYDESFKTKALENSNLAHGVPVAIGTRIVITANDKEGAYVNGDTGEIEAILVEDGRDFEKAVEQASEKRFRIHALQVKLQRTGLVVTVPRIRREVSDPMARPQYTVTGFPIGLGYALTIHKAQGMTVDKAYVDLASLRAFPDQLSKHGLAYVALSRTRTLGGLLIGEWAPDVIYCNNAIRELI